MKKTTNINKNNSKFKASKTKFQVTNKINEIRKIQEFQSKLKNSLGALKNKAFFQSIVVKLSSTVDIRAKIIRLYFFDKVHILKILFYL